jgi:hypothetical protein
MRIARQNIFQKSPWKFRYQLVALLTVAGVSLTLQACMTNKDVRESEPVHEISYKADRTKIAHCANDHYLLGDNNAIPIMSETKDTTRISGLFHYQGTASLAWEAILTGGTAYVRQGYSFAGTWGKPTADAIKACDQEILSDE